jgi:hypothetical protein
MGKAGGMRIGATGFEPVVALYLLPNSASVGSIEAVSDQSTAVFADRRSQ